MSYRATDRFENWFITSLQTGINDTTSSFRLNNNLNVKQARLVIDPYDPSVREVVKVTSVDGNLVYVERGDDNTAPQYHLEGAIVALNVVAADMNDLYADFAGVVDATDAANQAASDASAAASDASSAATAATTATGLANTATSNANAATTAASNAASAANSAASSATTATSAATTATGLANTATSNANTATTNANSAASSATSATTAANNAASSANSAASDASSAATAATTATGNANAATSAANSAASSANSAASSANTAASNAQTAADNAQGIVDDVAAAARSALSPELQFSGGRVGVGKVPAANRKLDVDGDIYSNGVKVSTHQPLNYSTSEQSTGRKWIGGQAIFEKTINLGALPNATTKNVAHGVTIGRLLGIKGHAHRGGNNAVFSLPHSGVSPTSSNLNITVYVKGANIVVETGVDRSPYSGYVTIEYIK